MNSRVDIKNFILDIEEKYPVNNWKSEGIHIWPILRIRLFFYLIKYVEKIDVVESNPVVKKSPQSIKFILKDIARPLKLQLSKIVSYFKFRKWISGLPNKKYLFLGIDSHRVSYKNKRYNRYFDVFIEKYGLQSESMYFEYDMVPVGNQFNPHLIYKFQASFSHFFTFSKKKQHQFEWEGYDDFLNFLAQNPITEKFSVHNSKSNIEKWFPRFALKIQFFKKILHRVMPSKVLILCYYSEDIMAFTAAANALGIETIEMQHGPQTAIHLAYSNWMKLPEMGYDVLPRMYWCWDKSSTDILSNLSTNSNLYQAKEIGNPWITYWNSKNSTYEFSDYILYALQPRQVCTIPELFPPHIISFIKNQPYKWFLRLHPRQMEDQAEIETFLKQQDVFDLVNIENATHDPLPQLLLHAKVHICHCSGTTIEADFFNVFTVLINEIGIDSFPDMIASGRAAYLDVKNDDFTPKFSALLENEVLRRRDVVRNEKQPSSPLFD